MNIYRPFLKKFIPGEGYRNIALDDIAPECEILINKQPFELKNLVKGKKVADIGCGDGGLRKIVEDAGGKWIGVEVDENGEYKVRGDAQNLPFKNCSFDVVIMQAVLQHIPEATKAICEVSRILNKGGLFIGYVAFMESFHGISYSHLSFKALEYFADINNMKLEKISGGRRFGIDYHFGVLLLPIKLNFLRGFIAFCIRSIIWIKAKLVFIVLRFIRREDKAQARRKAYLYFKVECLRLSVGFDFMIRKL